MAKTICLRLIDSSRLEKSSDEDEFPVPEQIITDCTELKEMYEIKEQPTMVPRETIMTIPDGSRFRIETSMVWKTDRLATLPNFIISLMDLAREKRIDLSLQKRFGLSRRELDVVYYLTSALSYDEIADKLFISKQTVHTHVKNIYRKIGARNRAELYRNIKLQL